MRELFQFPLCPFSRKVRIVLAEKNLEFEIINENFWERKSTLAQINPAMQVPVLIDRYEDKEIILPDSYSICEYLEEKYPSSDMPLFGNSIEKHAEVRRLVSWFDNKFFNEVNRYIINEKVVRYYTGIGQSLSDAIRAAKTNLIPHLEYITYLLYDNKWLTGDKITLADIAAAAHLSVLDYLNEITWENYEEVKNWYALIKCRPSFRSLLADRMPGFHPPKCYANLDF